jgi:hypothetical protein
MGDFVGDNSKQVSRNGVGMQEHGFFSVMRHAFAKLLIRGPLNPNCPPNAIHFEAH